MTPQPSPLARAYVPCARHGSGERIDVVETGATTPVGTDVDIVLYDTFGQVQGDGIDLQGFVHDSDAKVVMYSWNLQPELIARAVEAGANGYLSKALTGPEIVEALERIMDGESVILPGDHETSVDGAGNWPGRVVGLSPREAEVIALITQGLSNQQIADRAYLSINSVKTYIRAAYRKIGVHSRTHAVRWGMTNGLEPDHLRIIPPALRVRLHRSPGLSHVPDRSEICGHGHPDLQTRGRCSICSARRCLPAGGRNTSSAARASSPAIRTGAVAGQGDRAPALSRVRPSRLE